MTHHTSAADLTFAKDGAEHFHAAALSALPGIRSALSDIPLHQAGVRIHGAKTLVPLLAARGPIGSLAAALQPAPWTAQRGMYLCQGRHAKRRENDRGGLQDPDGVFVISEIHLIAPAAIFREEGVRFKL
ncbi:hypothetical protein [Novosphingobium pentaromativorans]|uniref:hypothetical protein n=1 Tax=Novosphingobium pentaromativorans TaxID=205844 RepID=UPI00051F7AF7|nr:hypothetical protein [Novosphingobium pentaromativorans]AIT82062.1 hypothetical protein JI59_21200 [Novosphingobium pentaromativorans US6-1]